MTTKTETKTLSYIHENGKKTTANYVTVTNKEATSMAKLALSKWGDDTECYRLLDQYKIAGIGVDDHPIAKPGERVLIQVISYDTGDYVDVFCRGPLPSLAAANSLIRNVLNYEGRIRLAVAVYTKEFQS